MNEKRYFINFLSLLNQIRIELSKCKTHDDASADGDQTARR